MSSKKKGNGAVAAPTNGNGHASAHATSASFSDEYLDCLCVGAGLSGIDAAYHMKNINPNMSFKVLERRPNLGGTWSLFSYPSCRSDSDLFTFGLPSQNWKRKKRFGKAGEIIEYLDDFASYFDLHKCITYNRRVDNMSWSDSDGVWTLRVSAMDPATNSDEKASEAKVLGTYSIVARYVILATGYFSYTAPYTPKWDGMDKFKGPIVHPQFWPKDLDYKNKHVVVIGSGATAITLIPGLTEGGEEIAAKKVTMLQRTPSYVAMLPQQGGVVNFWITAYDKLLCLFISWNEIANIIRWTITLVGWFFYWLMRTFPNFGKKMLLDGVRKSLGPEEADRLMPHFTPPYAPWDQRLCVTPDDNNIFEVLREKKADVVTDHIECFDEKGIQLKSGNRIDADIIVTATGLQLMSRGGIAIDINGVPAPKASESVLYRGCVVDLSNVFVVAGFFNASWTQRADPLISWACGLMKDMQAKGKNVFTPRMSDGQRKTIRPLHEMTSGYLQRGSDHFPKQAAFPFAFYPSVVKEWTLFTAVPWALSWVGMGWTWDGVLSMKYVEPPKKKE